MWVMTLIVASAIVGACVETNPPIHKDQEDVWFGIEAFFIANFSFEFLCRVTCTPSCKAFWSQGMNYVDLIAILPFYLKVFLGNGGNVGFLRVLRLGRAFRLVKMGRYSQGIRLVTNALAKSADALQLFCFLLILVLVVFSSGIYFFERGDWVEEKERYYRNDPATGQREDYESPFQSIPQSFWWCIVTLTTVGYGDMYPYSDLGKLFAVITMLVGLVMLALPLSIIGTNFIEERAVMNAENEYEDRPSANPTCLLMDMEYCLEMAKCLKQSVETMEQKLTQATSILDKVALQDSSLQETLNPLCEETVVKSHLEHGELSQGAKHVVSAQQVEQLLALHIELLAICMAEMDVWVEDVNVVDDLPKEIRELVIPLVKGKMQS